MICRGIYHAHSLYSGDGHYTLSELRRICLSKGVSFIIMTEHAEDMTPESLAMYVKECASCSDSSFLFVPGLEIPYVGKVHVGCFPVSAMPSVPMYSEGIASLHNKGTLTVIHHPSKQGYFIDKTLPSLIDYVEVWNARYEGQMAPSVRTLAFAHEYYPEKLLVGGFDLHTPNQLGGAYVEIDVPTLSVEGVCSAWRGGKVKVVGRYFSFEASKGIHNFKIIEHRIVRLVYTLLRAVRTFSF